jgi:hypothetical protein
MRGRPGIPGVLLPEPTLGLNRLIATLLLALAFAAPGGEAFANVCRSIQAELAAIGRGGGNPQAANRSAAEAARIYAHIRAIGCDRSGIFAFGAPPPQECAGLRARMQQHQQASASASGGEARRRELMSMLITHNCRTSAEPPRAQPLVAGLFDDRRQRASIEIRPDEDLDTPLVDSRIRSLSGRAVCVRSCDGYYFPVQVRAGTRPEEGDDICQSLCPASEAKLYTMRSRDIDHAVSSEGEAYSDLPNAFLYRKRFDPACACRRTDDPLGQSARVLNPDGSSGQPFDMLNPEAEAIEEPPLRGFSDRSRKADPSVFGKRPPPAPPAPPHPPQDMPAERMVTTEQGEVTEFKARDGSSRTVRIIAPELTRGPEAAKAPSAPARAPAP